LAGAEEVSRVDMKSIEEQTYYEILEVSPTSSAREIQRAYERARETYDQDSLAIYSLFTDQEIREIQTAIDEAYRVLMDDALRKNYNESRLPTLEGVLSQKVPESENDFRRTKEFKGVETYSPPSADIVPDLSVTGYRGESLKSVRERLGIDLKDISAQTRIHRKILEWIEEEAYEKLPPLVYLKGFLRSYAQCLGLDSRKVIEDYLKLTKASQKK
jgi:curved DNA-binding protein CbpA